MDRTPKPYYPGFRDMNLWVAFGLTALFFVVIWLVVLTARVIGIRRRIDGLDAAIAEAEKQLDALTQQLVSEAAFATAPVQSRDLASIVSLLQRSDDPRLAQQAEVLADLDRALDRVRTNRMLALSEHEQLVSHPIAAFLERLLVKP